MSQGTTILATTGVFSGATEQANINSALAALLSLKSGATAPTTDLVAGQFWLDTSGGATAWLLKEYTGSTWVTLLKFDTTNALLFSYSNGIANNGPTSSIAQAATTDLGTATSTIVDLTGASATITSLGASCPADRMFFVRVNTATPGTLTHAASLLLPGSANIAMQQNDFFVAKSLGSGNFIVLEYFRAGGVPLLGLKIGKETIAIDAGGMIPRATSGATPNQRESTTNKVNVKTIEFPKAASPVSTYAQFKVPMPKSWNGGTVTVRLFGRVFGSASAANAIMSIAGRCYSQGDLLDQAMGTAVNITFTATGTAEQEIITAESSAITIAGTVAGNKVIVFELARLAANGGDTMATGVTVSIEALHIYYTLNASDDT